MSIEDAATVATVLASGLIFYFSGHVIYRHIRLWMSTGHNLLPLHVWLISISYNGLVISLLTNERDFHTRFWIYFPSLLLGVFSLYILSKGQRRRARSLR